MGSLADEPVETLFDTNVVPQAPEDPLFGLMAAYRKDTYEKKVDLGIGAYRDNHAKPWVLPVVKKVGLYQNLPRKSLKLIPNRPMKSSGKIPT